MPTGPNRQSTIQRIVLRVDEVDIPNRQIHGYDKTNVLVIATFRETPAGVLHIPSQNERWIAERQGQGHWRLVGRLDSADDQTVLQNLMQPGDVRIGDIEPDPNDTSRFNGSGTVFSPTLQAYLFATPYDTYSVKNGDIEVGSGHGAIQTTDGSTITSITLTNRPATWGCYVFMRNITGQPILFEQSNVGPNNFEKSLRASFTLANRAWVVLFLDGWGAQWCPIAMGTEAGIADALPGDGTRNLDGLGHWTVPSVSSQAILSLGPSLYWRLDEKLGTIAHDSSGNSRNGTYDTGMTLGHTGGLIGDPATSVYSPPSAAADNSAHGDVPSTYKPFIPGGDRTFIGWSYVNNLSIDGGPVMFGGRPEGFTFLWIEQGTTDVTFSPNSLLTWTAAWPGINQWVHWAVTYTSATKTAELFINGVSKGTKVSANDWPAVAENDVFVLGELDGLGGNFEDVAIYESVLTAAEIGMIYGAGLGPGGYLTPSSAVTSFNTRTGAVVSQTGDYTAAEVTNAADKSSVSAQVFSGDIEIPQGSATTPSLSFSADTSSGLYQSATHRVGLSANGTQRASFANDSTLGAVCNIGGSALPASQTHVHLGDSTWASLNTANALTGMLMATTIQPASGWATTNSIFGAQITPTFDDTNVTPGSTLAFLEGLRVTATLKVAGAGTTVTTINGITANVTGTSGDNTAVGTITQFNTANSTIYNTVTTWKAVAINTPTIGSGGSIGTLYGLNISDMSAVGATTSWGLAVFGSNQNSFFQGKCRFGGSTAPTQPVDVTGNVNVSGEYMVGGVQIAASNLSNGTTGSGAIVLAGSPALTGTPTAPTPAETDDSTTIATTAFVHNVMPEGVIVPYGGLAAPTGWLLCDGSAVSRSTYATLFNVLVTNKGTVTITIAAPGVVTLNAHGFNNGDVVYFETTGALPTGLTADTPYYVVAKTTNTFEVAATFGGAAITTSGTQSGTHTCFQAPYALSTMGATTFNVPDMRGNVPVGKDTATFINLGNAAGAETTTDFVIHTHTFTGSAMGTHSHANTAAFTGTSDTTGNNSASHTHTGPSHSHDIATSSPEVKYGAAYTTSGSSLGIGDIGGHTGSIETLNFSNTGTAAGTGATGTQSSDHTHTVTPTGTVAMTNHADSAGTPAGTNANAGTVSAVSLLQPYLVVNYIIKY